MIVETTFKMDKGEISRIDQRTRRMYVLRKEEKRGFVSIEDCVDISTQNLKKNIKKSKEK